MRNFIYSIMTDKRSGFVAKTLAGVLYIASLAYGLAIFIRRIFYRFGIFRAAKVPMKVISVGNLTLGGTGKTPFTITLGRILKDELGKEVCILIRGYGWDEQALLKRRLPDIPVLVGEDRARSSRRAIRLYGSDTAVLDDGFQHWELERDLNIVLVDSRNPFGNGYLFPRGILREPKRAVRRTDVIVFTKVNKSSYEIEDIKAELGRIKDGMIYLEAVHNPRNLYDFRLQREFSLGYIKGKRVILLSSIGDPSYFEDTARDLGAEIVTHLIFPDHHDYGRKDMDRVMRVCQERAFDMVVTTEKDAVKLSRLGISFKKYLVLTLMIEMIITNGKEELIDRLHSLYTGQDRK